MALQVEEQEVQESSFILFEHLINICYQARHQEPFRYRPDSIKIQLIIVAKIESGWQSECELLWTNLASSCLEINAVGNVIYCWT